MANRKAAVLRNRPSEKEQKLSRDAWLDATGRAIADGGFDNVRVLTLAKQLGVTRGSFYWHFTDHAELIASFLERWRDRRLSELTFLRQSGSSDEAETELRRILRLVLSEPARNTRQMRVELAVRDFARRDTYAATIVSEVDRARIDHCATLLGKVITDKEQAHDLALLLYVATIGGRVVLTSFSEGQETIDRIDHLVAQILAHKSQLI